MTVVVSFIYVSYFLRSAHPGRLRRRDSESRLKNRFVEKNNKTKHNRITRSRGFFVVVVIVCFRTFALGAIKFMQLCSLQS